MTGDGRARASAAGGRPPPPIRPSRRGCAVFTEPWLVPVSALGDTAPMRFWLTTILAAFALSAVAVGAMAAPIDDGLAAFEAEQYEAALEILRPLAEAGNIEAAYAVGVIYDFGRGVNQDDMAAGIWYRIAAEQGMPEAQLGMAVLFDTGEGILQSVVEAFAWSAIAADQGLRRAELLRDSVRSVMSRQDRLIADELKAQYWDLYVVPFQK